MADRRTIQVGDRIRDNDPRHPHRVLVVTGFVDVPLGGSSTTFVRKAVVRNAIGRESRIALGGIHVDGKPRRRGWSLVTA